MKKQITFRGMEHSNIIEEYANKQLEKIERFLQHEKEPIFIHMVLTAQHTHHHHEVELQITSPFFSGIVRKEGPEFYDLISIVCDAIYLQLTEAKRKLVDDRHTGINKRQL